MTYDDECFNCPYRQLYVDNVILKAKKWHEEMGAAWIFQCGAAYHSKYIPEIRPYKEDCLFKQKTLEFVNNLDIFLDILSKLRNIHLQLQGNKAFEECLSYLIDISVIYKHKKELK